MLLHRPLALCAAIIVALAVPIAATCAPARAATQAWLVASDVHLDPYDRDSDPAQMGSDSNLALFRSTIAAMKRAVPDPQVVLLPGDFFVHDFANVARDHKQTPTQAGIATTRIVVAAFAAAFPKAQFAIALGNNDAPCGDYHSQFGDGYMQQIARLWAPLVNRGGRAPAFAQTFAASGAYTAALPLPGLRLVAIDTVPLSSQYRGNCGSFGLRAAARQLDWLDATLRATPKGTRNVVMMHIPPGYDAFTTETTHGYLPWEFLRGNASRALAGAIANPASRVAFAIAGHTHRYDVRIDGGVPMVLVGSVSPVYHGNPMFFVLHVGAGGSLDDVDQYAYDEWTQAWQPPRSLDRKWSVARVDAATLTALHGRLGSDPSMRALWDAQSAGWPSNPSIAWDLWRGFWRIPWCAQMLQPTESFAQCADIERRMWMGRAAIAGIVLLAIVLCGLVVWLVLRIVQRRRGSRDGILLP